MCKASIDLAILGERAFMWDEYCRESNKVIGFKFVGPIGKRLAESIEELFWPVIVDIIKEADLEINGDPEADQADYEEQKFINWEM